MAQEKSVAKEWHIYFHNIQETFFQRLDRVIHEWNCKFPEDRIDWPAPKYTAKEENARRIQLRKILTGSLFDEKSKIPRRWIPSVKADAQGCPIEQLSGKEITDPSLSSGEQHTRENILKFCASFKLNGKQTKHLMHTVFFCRFFNLKNHFEMVCCFYTQDPCEKNWYALAKEFLKKNNLETIPYQVPEDTMGTEEIPLTEISSEAELAEYIRDHLSLFAPQNQYITAKDCVDTDIDLAWERAVNEVVNDPPYRGNFARQLSDERKKPLNIYQVEMAKLVQVIVGHAIDRKKSVNNYDATLLPERIHENFPTSAILQDIRSGVENSMDRIRKAIILLAFYNFCTGASNKKCCEAEINSRLQDSNLPELCEHDLYDALFLYAVSHPAPLTVFREIMSQAKPDKGSA